MARGFASSLLVVLAVAAVETAASADEPSVSAATEAAASVTLTLTPASGAAPWRMRIENTGEGPVRVPANPNLLTLEITPPAVSDAKAKKPTTVTCALPADTRPSTDEGSELVIPAKRSWSASIDPLFYCFGARERAALVKDATITARFGWHVPPPARGAKSKAPAPPFAVAPVGASVGRLLPAKFLESAPFTLGESVSSRTEATTTSSSSDAPVKVSTLEASDVARGGEITSTVTVTNTSPRSVTLFLRPSTVGFTVASASGSVTCGQTKTSDSPMRELFTTLGAKGSTAVTLLLSAVCPSGTFDEPGLYRVTPRVDTSGVSGRTIGLTTWDGDAHATKPMLLRVRLPRAPRSLAPATLD